IAEVLTTIQDDAGADGLAGEAGAAAAGGEGHLHLGGDLDRGAHVLDGARDDHAERLDLVDAGVGAVQPARGGVEAHLAGEVLAQVLAEGQALQLGEVDHEGAPIRKWRQGLSLSRPWQKSAEPHTSLRATATTPASWIPWCNFSESDPNAAG